MPQKKSAPCLKKICLTMLARNMDYWCKDYVENFSGQKVLCVIGPFDGLPHVLLGDLLAILKKEKLKRPHLDFLIQPELERIDLSNSYTADLPYALNLIRRVCKNLQYLDLSNCQKISHSAFVELPQFIPCIRILKLRSTCCSDAVLSVIGGHCPKLCDLDVSHCSRVTDAGISSLCIGIEEKDENCRTSKLQNLCLTATSITVNGAICALKYLPILKSLSSGLVARALKKMHEEDFLNNSLHLIKKYDLQSLSHDCDGMMPEESQRSLDISSALCPDVIKFSLDEGYISDESLLVLTRFKHLQELRISSDCIHYISFEKGLAPVLQVVGDGLKVLTLIEIAGIDTSVVGDFCPNLEKFQIVFPKGYQMLTQKRLSHSERFRQLRDLQLINPSSDTHPDDRVDIPANMLFQMLTESINLQRLTLAHCYHLNDSMLSEIVKLNTFPRLDDVDLSSCDTLTADGILTLLKLNNPLRRLNLYQCLNVMYRDAQSFRNLIADENLDIDIQWM